MAGKKEPPHEVGYGKPPKHTQFEPGKSGNPNGRPKGSKNFATTLNEALKERVLITENGKRRKITKREVIAKQLVNKAASGDPRAIPILLNEIRIYESKQEAIASDSDADLSAEEEALFARYLKEDPNGG